MSIIISTIEELQLIGNDPGYPLDEDYELSNDIDASITSTWNGGEGFIPIGSYGSPNYFIGTFDGKNHTITNLYINRSSNGMALFGQVSSTNIQNIGLIDVNITTDKSFSGGLIAYTDPSPSSRSLINNSYVSGVINCHDYSGGLIGFSQKLDITGSYTNINVMAGLSDSIGGLIGHCYDSTVNDCHAEGTVSTIGMYSGGLIGYFTIASEIYNSYADCTISGARDVGGLIGSCGTNDIIIDTCYSKGIVTGSDIYIGGLIGYSTSFTLSNCYSECDVYGTGSSKVDCAGLIGHCNIHTSITNCYTTGNIYAPNYQYVGGLVNDLSASITNCYTTGNVTGIAFVGGLAGQCSNSNMSNCYTTGNITGVSYLGGITGNFYGSSSINNCYTIGKVTSIGSGPFVGGFLGYGNISDISKCYSAGDIIGNNQFVGGFSGQLFGNVINCYAAGSVTNNSSNNYTGGFSGVFSGTLSKSYSSGLVISSGGIVGGFLSDYIGSVTDCYWDTEASGQLTSAAGVGKTTVEMKTQATFVNWDFNTIWVMYENYTYPLFELPILPNNPSVTGMVTISQIDDNNQSQLIEKQFPFYDVIPSEVYLGVTGISESISEYRWDFGDGNSSSMKSPVHTYNTYGHHNIISFVKDYGVTWLQVGNKDNRVIMGKMEIDASPRRGDKPLSVSFINESISPTGSHYTGWQWHYGDGYGATGAIGQDHTYIDYGSYTIEMDSNFDEDNG